MHQERNPLPRQGFSVDNLENMWPMPRKRHRILRYLTDLAQNVVDEGVTLSQPVSRDRISNVVVLERSLKRK